MSEFTFVCPYCQASLAADDSERGVRFACPNCSTGLVVPRVAPAPDVPPDDLQSHERQDSAASTFRDTNHIAAKATSSHTHLAPSHSKEMSDEVRWRIRSLLFYSGAAIMLLGFLVFCSQDFSGESEETRNLALIIGCVGGFVFWSGIAIPNTHRTEAALRLENERRKIEQRKAQESFDRKMREHPNQCPQCDSHDFQVYFPSKPRVWAPLNLSGIFLLAASSAAADAIYKPEKVCLKCGQRWPAPEYE